MCLLTNELKWAHGILVLCYFFRFYCYSRREPKCPDDPNEESRDVLNEMPTKGELQQAAAASGGKILKYLTKDTWTLLAWNGANGLRLVVVYCSFLSGRLSLLCHCHWHLGLEHSETRLGHQATIHTTVGDILVKLFPQEVPKTVENFTVHAGNSYYNGVLFHRVIKGFMIQTGTTLIIRHQNNGVELSLIKRRSKTTLVVLLCISLT